MRSTIITKIIITVSFIVISLYSKAQEKEYYNAIVADKSEDIIKYGEILLNKESDTKEVLRKLASTYDETRNLTKAILYLERAYKVDSNDVKTLWMLSNAYLSIGNEDKAFETLYKSLEIDSLNIYAYSTLAKIEQSVGDIDRAIMHTKKLCEIDSTNAIYFSNLGRLYDKKNSSNKALNMYEKSAKLDSLNISTLLLLSRSQIINDQYGKALNTANKGLALIGESKSRLRQMLLRNKSNAYYQMQQWDSCIVYAKAGQALGDTVENYTYRLSGYANLKKGFFLDATENLQIAYGLSTEADSMSFHLPMLLGQAYFEVYDLKNAEKYFDKAIANITPDGKQMFTAYSSYGKLKEKQKEYEKALVYYEKMKEFDPESAIPYEQKSKLLRSLRRNDEYTTELNRYITLVDKRRKQGKEISENMEKNYFLVQKMIERAKVSKFFKEGNAARKN